MAKIYKKKYRDPHAKQKAALAAILALALSRKQQLVLQYVADNGSAGLLDYAETVLDDGWDAYWQQATDILDSAATDSTLETLDNSGEDVTDEFIANIAKENDLIAKTSAASLLGLVYDFTRDTVLPVLAGWTLGDAILTALTKVLDRVDTEQLPATDVESAIAELSVFTPKRAEQMAHNALAYVDGSVARRTAGVTGADQKRSLTVEDSKVCVDCEKNQADGWIGINEQFSGSLTEDTPHHPACRCSCEYRWSPKPQVEREVALAS